jgi:hypothetical protein
MGKGLARALLVTSLEAFKGAAGIQKISTPGYLQYLLENNKPNVISNGKDDGSGYIRDITLRYRNRGVTGKSVTEDNCSIQVRPAYLETAVAATSYRAIGLTFEDDVIAKFEQDALAAVSAGTPAMSMIMKDIYEAIIEQANGIFGDIDKDLLAVQAANWGVNVVPGNNAARTINLALNGANNDLDSGMTRAMSDAMENEVRMDGMVAVGSGLINNYFLQQRAKSYDQAGLNTSQLGLPKFYYDHYAQAAWGVNKFGLFERDAVQFVNVCRFRGIKGGLKGGDWFMTLRLPVTDSLGQGNMSAYEFDVQLKYRTCPGEEQIGAYSEDNPPVQLGRGWNIIISSSYQIVHQPADSYAATDRLYGVNGSFLYTATNA